jgi:hypothetical protein
MASQVVFPTGLSLDTCLQRGQATARDMGFQNVGQSINNPGMGWVSGVIGEYRMRIACIAAKDTIVFFIAGPDGTQAANYLKSIGEGMGKPK